MDKKIDEFLFSTNKDKLDIKLIHVFLTKESGWSNGISLELVKKSIANSLNFGVYHKNNLVGYARVISDFSTIAYLGDVFIIKEYRGLGLSKKLMEIIHEHQELKNLRRWILVTNDTHELYKKYGWSELADSSKWMELYNKNIYSK